MADFMSRANLAGAVDLSGLRKTPPVSNSAPDANSANTGENSNTPAATVIKVPDLSALGTEENIKNFVTISQSVPVLIDFLANDLEISKILSAKLDSAVRALNGKIFLLKVDTKTQIQVAQAFEVKQVPTVVAMIKGQPIPLFEGDQPLEAIQTVLDRVLQVASENGVSALLEVSSEFNENDQNYEVPEPALSQNHQLAFDAIDSGDYDAAVSAYEAAIRESPSDKVAVAGLAQAKLLVRTKNLDFETIMAADPKDLDAVLQKADALVSMGQAEQGYTTILNSFATADKDEGEKLRLRLLELFELSQPDAPELAQARRTLAALLY